MDFIAIDNGELSLVPGNSGEDCPGNPEGCDECDYLICCTNANGLCDKCFAAHGECEINARRF
ncbi:MAG: hypothetical protein FWC27_13035 [Firmicutes bacterium]|nr:hypothetical protein [Bacillota bacterium]